MTEKIEFLEFLKTQKTDNEIIEEFGIETEELLTENIIKKYIEQKGEYWLLTDKGLIKLEKLRESEKKNFIQQTTIHYNGDGGNIVTHPINSEINQSSKIKKVPPKFEYSSNPLIEWILEKFGKRISSWIFGVLFLLSASAYSFFGIKKGFFPSIYETNPSSSIFSIQSLLLGILIILIIIFISIKGHAKKERCPKCNKILSHISWGDGEIIDEAPNNVFKVKRNYRCPCGYEYSRTRWEYPPEKKKIVISST